MQVVTVEVPELGNRTHLVHDGATGVVVDAPRHYEALERAAEDAGVDIVAVADTHVHNDYLSGGPALARRHGAEYLLNADERVRFARTGVRDGDRVPVGGLTLQVIASPGHTFHHQSFLVVGPEGPGVLLSGGSLLHGTVGRTDLVDPTLSRLLARQQWHSARGQAALPGETLLRPTHGFGSFCASTSVDGGEAGRLADEQLTNAVLFTEREAFVRQLLAGFGPVPDYYRHMAPLNRAGEGARRPRPPAWVDQEAVHRAVAEGRWVVDVRDRHAFAHGHLTGTVNVEAGHQLATYVGWLAPWGSDLLLVGDEDDALELAVRHLSQIGVEVAGVHRLDPVHRWRDSQDHRIVGWEDWAAGAGSDVTLDVRMESEHRGGVLAGAVRVPLHELEQRTATLPAGRVWVHCRSGFRAAIAASMLSRAGREVLLVDDDWDRAAELGLPLTGLPSVA